MKLIKFVEAHREGMPPKGKDTEKADVAVRLVQQAQSFTIKDIGFHMLSQVYLNDLQKKLTKVRTFLSLVVCIQRLEQINQIPHEKPGAFALLLQSGTETNPTYTTIGRRY